MEEETDEENYREHYLQLIENHSNLFEECGYGEKIAPILKNLTDEKSRRIEELKNHIESEKNPTIETLDLINELQDLHTSKKYKDESELRDQIIELRYENLKLKKKNTKKIGI